MYTPSEKKTLIEEKIKSWHSAKTPEELIKEDEYILMSNYLSEIERIKDKIGLTRKSLAEKINTSASYLTQVFRGDKPLNFYTLAKIQKALGVRFQVTARRANEISFPLDKSNVYQLTPAANKQAHGKSETFDVPPVPILNFAQLKVS